MLIDFTPDEAKWTRDALIAAMNTTAEAIKNATRIHNRARSFTDAVFRKQELSPFQSKAIEILKDSRMHQGKAFEKLLNVK